MDEAAATGLGIAYMAERWAAPSKLLAFLADQRGRLARKASELQRLISFRNVSTTLIQPGLEFRLGWSGRLCGIELSEAAGFLV